MVTCYADIASTKAIHVYFSQLLKLKSPDAQYAWGILALLQKDFSPPNCGAAVPSHRQPNQTPAHPLQTGAQLVERLRSDHFSPAGAVLRSRL